MAQGMSTQYAMMSAIGPSVIPPRHRSAKPSNRATVGASQRNSVLRDIKALEFEAGSLARTATGAKGPSGITKCTGPASYPQRLAGITRNHEDVAIAFARSSGPDT